MKLTWYKRTIWLLFKDVDKRIMKIIDMQFFIIAKKMMIYFPCDFLIFTSML
jgi:hypothetical protein